MLRHGDSRILNDDQDTAWPKGGIRELRKVHRAVGTRYAVPTSVFVRVVVQRMPGRLLSSNTPGCVVSGLGFFSGRLLAAVSAGRAHVLEISVVSSRPLAL